MMNTRTVKVDWDDDQEIYGESGLPTEVQVPADLDDEDVADWLSEKYGFCVNSWEEL